MGWGVLKNFVQIIGAREGAKRRLSAEVPFTKPGVGCKQLSPGWAILDGFTTAMVTRSLRLALYRFARDFRLGGPMRPILAAFRRASQWMRHLMPSNRAHNRAQLRTLERFEQETAARRDQQTD